MLIISSMLPNKLIYSLASSLLVPSGFLLFCFLFRSEKWKHHTGPVPLVYKKDTKVKEWSKSTTNRFRTLVQKAREWEIISGGEIFIHAQAPSGICWTSHSADRGRPLCCRPANFTSVLVATARRAFTPCFEG
jgi:hypothetical protein